MKKENNELSIVVFELLNLLFRKFFKAIYIIEIILFVLLAINMKNIISFAYSFNFSEYVLIKDYLGVIISWPISILILGLIFIFKFSDSIAKFLENSQLDGAGPLQVSPIKQEPSLVTNSPRSSTGKENDRELELKEISEFLYINSFLVNNSKRALFWFYNQKNQSSTKQNFISMFPLQEQIIDQTIEKENIFNALFSTQLLEKDGENFNVSEKGTKFLKILNYIK